MDMYGKTDRAEDVRDVLQLLTDVLCAVEPQQELALSPEGVSGLTLLLLACIDTLEAIK